MNSSYLINILSSEKIPVQNEKETQLAIEKILLEKFVPYSKEYKLDEKNIPDFFIQGIAIEVKIKGNARKIYKQCERYCQFDEVSELLLITNRSMGFPKEINGISCYVLNISKAWL